MNDMNPELRATLDTLPPCRALGALPDGLLPVVVADEDLAVEIDWWEDVHEQGQLQLQWNGVLYGPAHVITQAEAEDPSTRFTFFIDKAELVTEGSFTLAYRFLSDPGENEYFSDPQTLRVDRSAPGGGALPQLMVDPEIINLGVTPDKLDQQGRLHTTLQGYEQKRAGDTVLPLISAMREGLPVMIEDAPIRVTSNDQNQPVTVYFNLAKLLEVGDGPADFTYRLRDRAGNTSDLAPVRPLQILLQNVPDTLLPPRVPLYEENGLIDEERARRPVQVVIPHYEHAAVDDLILLNWGTVPAQTYVVRDENADPLLTIDFPYRLVQLGGNGSLAITYEVRRNGVSLGTSPITQIAVDITLPGGPDPDPENPEHGNLELPEALGASGVPNVISAADLELPAEVVIDWYGKDGKEVFLENDRVNGVWASINLPHVVSANEVIAKQPLRLTITSEQMKQAGSGRLALSYSVTRELTGHPGYSNTAYSSPQAVEVADPSELPGGGDPLPAADFPEKNDRNTINKEAAVDGTPYEIRLDYENAAVGDRIDFKFRGHQGFSDDPKLEPDHPIAGSYMEASHTLTRQDLDQGTYAFTVGRAQLVAINRGSGNGYHWITNNAGTAPAAYYHVFVDTVDLEP
ncbi:MAG TPA: hypothetical protein VG536_04070 [Pseudomonas sp.]|nr:hypothetical protein [Pseudomonas sp.]